MSRLFDAVDDGIDLTMTAIDTGDITVGCWCYPTGAGESSNGTILQVNNGTPAVVLRFAFQDASRHLRAELQQSGGVGGISHSNETLALSTWAVIVATYRDSDDKWRLYIGDLDSVVAECTYSLQQARTGTRLTGGTAAYIGKDGSGGRTWDGRISHVFHEAREWSIDEIERFRQGFVPVQSGSLRWYLPLTSPTVTQNEDLSGNGANGTVNSTPTLAEDPPVPINFGTQPQEMAVGVSATPTPSEIAGTTGVATPSVQTGSTVTPGAIDAVADIESMGGQVDETVTPTAIAGVTAVATPTVTTGPTTTVTPSTIGATVGVETPIVTTFTFSSGSDNVDTDNKPNRLGVQKIRTLIPF